MDRKQYVVSQEGGPVLFEVGKWGSKINIFGTYTPSDYELESNFRGVVDLPIVESPFVVHREFGIILEEVCNAF